MPTMIAVRVWRGGSAGTWQDFAVPRRDAQTVLDVVTHIQHHQDATLGMFCTPDCKGWKATPMTQRPVEDSRCMLAPPVQSRLL